jgi:3-deoxy-D-manno-octulosonic-acid transferase
LLIVYNQFVFLMANLLPFLERFWPSLRKDVLSPRKDLLDRWQKNAIHQGALWFHVSSVGELEQVRPVIEALKKKNYVVYLSFFSSSVPRLVKDWGFVDYADFLPLDFPSEMEKILDILQPKLLVFNRYDLWPNLMHKCRQKGIPIVVVNASIPPQGWFGRFSVWARKQLFYWVDGWTFVDANAAQQWEPVVYGRVKGLVTGDPRVDRALQRVDAVIQEGKAKERLSIWHRSSFCFVAGSTWPEDEAVILDFWGKVSGEKSLVIVPHEPTEEHLQKLQAKLKQKGFSWVRFSELNVSSKADVLLVDQRGILAELYALGSFAYVGGGFGRQIHSVVEPVAHGIPVVFGPHYHRSPEALSLLAAGGAKALGKRPVEELLNWLETFRLESGKREKVEEAIRIFLQIHKGAGFRIADFLLDGLKENSFQRLNSDSSARENRVI